MPHGRSKEVSASARFLPRQRRQEERQKAAEAAAETRSAAATTSVATRTATAAAQTEEALEHLAIAVLLHAHRFTFRAAAGTRRPAPDGAHPSTFVRPTRAGN